MKKNMAGLALGCAALALIAGSFAFYTSTDTFDNPAKTIGYAHEGHEKYTPEPDWQPGEVLTKEFGVKNTGTGDLLVRVKLSEQWWRDTNKDGVMQDSEKIISFDSTSGNHDDIITYTQVNEHDGDVTGDKSVVEKTLAGSGWSRGTDGYWYYNTILTPTGSTSQTNLFLTKIKLANGVDEGLKEQHKYWTENDALENVKPKAGAGGNIGTDSRTAWVEFDVDAPVPYPQVKTNNVYVYSEDGVDSDHLGYSSANYDLFITYDTIQATVDAVKSSDGWNLTAAPAGTNWGFNW